MKLSSGWNKCTRIYIKSSWMNYSCGFLGFECEKKKMTFLQMKDRDLIKWALLELETFLKEEKCF